MKRWVPYLFWGLATLAAATPWVLLLFDGEIWAVFLYPNHRNILYALIGVVVGVFTTAVFLDLPRGLKLIVASSAIAFLAAMARGWWVSISEGDCSTLCLGVLNNVLGLGCGLADEGCATEFFFLLFLLLFLLGASWMLVGSVLAKRREHLVKRRSP